MECYDLYVALVLGDRGFWMGSLDLNWVAFPTTSREGVFDTLKTFECFAGLHIIETDEERDQRRAEKGLELLNEPLSEEQSVRVCAAIEFVLRGIRNPP
jgi:hypothetical protein